MEGFPFDGIERLDHGRVMAIIVSAHPLVFWIPAMIIGFILGYVW